MPDLSIITINFNNAEGLQATIQSVLQQGFSNYEYIIIDGGSTDGSEAVIQSYPGKFSYAVSEKDNGIYDAINKGIQHAKGKYCMFLNSGDLLLKEDVLQNAFACISKEYLDIYYGDVLLESPEGEQWVQTHAPILDLDFLQKRTLNHQASFIKRALFFELGSYKETYGLAADYAFYLTAFLKEKRFQYIDEVMVLYKRNGISSLQMETYIQQMREVWNELVPAQVTKLLEENRRLKASAGRKKFRLPEKLNSLYRKLKK